MAIISRLGVLLGLDSAEFNAGLGKAESRLTAFASNAMTSKLSLAALTAAFAVAATKAVDFADKINDVAKANEVSVESVLKLSKALTVNGGESENAGKMFSAFTNKLDEAAKGSKDAQATFAKLGITLDDLGKLSQQQLFDKAMRGMTDPKMNDVISRNAAAMDIWGKAAKGVDIKGLAQDYVENQENFKKAEKAFADIGKAMDTWDKLTLQLKTSTAQNLAPALSETMMFLDTIINGWDRLEKNIDKAHKAKIKFDNQGAEWKPTAGFIGQPMSQDEIEAIRKITGGSARDVKAGDADAKAAAAKKLTDEYEKQKTALYQQSLELDRQLRFVGQQQTGAEKLALEFEKGGKYARLKGTADEKAIMNQQRQLDLATQQHERAKELTQQAIKKEEVERAAREARAQEVAQMAIQRMEHDRSFEKTVKELDFAKERLELEKTMAGQADVKVDKALALFDLEKEILRLKRDDKLVTEEQIEAYRRAATARIEADEANTRAQHTFQAGWDKAYNNFAERAKDSAALGAEAFNTMTSGMESALDNFVRTGKLSFSDLINSMISDLLRMMLKAQATSLFGSIFGDFFGSFGGGGVSATAGAYSIDNNPFIGAYADGGNPPVGVPSLVGERGAELFVPRTAGTIVPNHSLSSVLGNQPQTVYNGTVIQNMSAIDTQSAVQFLSRNKQAVWSANQSAQRSLPMSR